MPSNSILLQTRLDSLNLAQKFFCACYANVDTSVETLWVAHLDQLFNCIHLSSHAGSGASAPFPLNTIIRNAVEFGSAGILLAHNHPSGNVRPSETDLAATHRLAVVCDALECSLLDHLIFSSEDCSSFRSLGLL